MSRHEDDAYRFARSRTGLAELRSQLSRLTNDLEQISARKAGSSLIAPLEARIRQLRSEVAEAEAEVRRAKVAREAAPGPDEGTRPGRSTVRSTAGHFPPRRRSGA